MQRIGNDGAFGVVRILAAALLFIVVPFSGGFAMESKDLPARMPDDAVMASPAQINQIQSWARQAFTGEAAPDTTSTINLKVIRQDHSVLRFGQSCIETPLRIGSQSYTHGLGTHAVSEVQVTVPAGAKSFRAAVGIDNNADTAGSRGCVIFSVESHGKEFLQSDAIHKGTELFRSAALRGDGEPVNVDVAIPEDSIGLITLRVDATDEGVGFAQADWADACFVMSDGAVRWLDDGHANTLLGTHTPPFSFKYDGKSSDSFLNGWTRETKTTEAAGETPRFTTIYSDPASGLRVTAELTLYTRYAVADWVLHFENTGTKPTPIISDIQALDTTLGTGYARHPVAVHTLEGDACGESSFKPKEAAIEIDRPLSFAPTGGRSSSISAFPFYNIQYEGQGIILAIGWTGQWRAQFDRPFSGPTRVRAGMELTSLRLLPGETIRAPRITMLAWDGDVTRAHNQWRRLLLDYYVPRLDGRPVRLPIALQTYDSYNARPGWATEAGQIEAVNKAYDLGCDTYWLDAAWFPGNFPNGVGNWFCKPEAFPRGLAPVSAVCHEKNMRFILWFEPERVAPGSQFANEYSQFVLGGKEGGLFNLGDPAAFRFLTDLLSQRITEYGVDVYRNDFNMDPLDYWRKNDAPDRQGMSEIRYVENLYAMWDELLARHPGLMIDNCSSGGRRIDMEMLMRSVPLWRSDTNCWAGHPDWNQAQTAHISQYVPLHTACTWEPRTYEARSASTGGLLCQFQYLSPDFDADAARKVVAEAKANQALWYGDYYPLTSCGTAPGEFAAYQFHRPDTGAGVVYAFRRSACNLVGVIIGLQAMDPAKTYTLQVSGPDGVATTKEVPGAELVEGFTLRVPEKNASIVIRYALAGDAAAGGNG